MHHRSEITVCLLLIMTTLAVYWQVRHHGFINYDDDDYVTENLRVQAGWTTESLTWAMTTRLHGHWHPLTWLSHMMDCQLFGLNPAGHHLSSVFLHLANTLLLFFVLNRMTGALLRSGLVAAMFALHPLHVEPVAWVADRKDVLSAFFWMLTLWAYVRYAESPGFTRYVLVVIAFILGLMAKSMVVTLPFVLLLIDYWPLERFPFEAWREKWKAENRRSSYAWYPDTSALRLVLEKVFFFVIVGASLVVTVSVMHWQRTQSLSLSGFWPTTGYIARSLVLSVTYMGKMLWPHHLATPYPSQTMPAPWQVVGALLLLSGISFLVIWQRRERPYLLMGWLWYLITLLPVIGLVQVGPHKTADRYLYIPLVGLFVMVAWGVPDLVKGWRHRRLLLGIFAGILVLGLAIGSWRQLRHWKDSITLFQHAVEVTSENWQAHNNLGVAHADEGDFEAAIGHYVEAIRIRPDYGKALFNLGVALADQGDLEGAIVRYSEAIRFNPTYGPPHHNLGVALAKQGRFKEAMGHFSEAIRLKPNYAEAHYNLGSVLARQGSLKEAIGHYKEAIRINPDYAEARYNLGVALTRDGDLKEAMEQFSEAVRIQPDYAKAHYNLGVLLAQEGRPEEAIGHFQEALRIKPDFAKARHNLDLAFELAGRSFRGSKTLSEP